MGLAMVYGIVKRHNGTLDIDSSPGRGTSVIIRIPLVQEHIGISQYPVSDLSEVRPLNILPVDDDENSRVLLAGYLAIDTHRVTQAIDGTDGIAKFNQGSFDLVITDQVMSRISGDRPAQHVKKFSDHTPVLIITGFALIISDNLSRVEGADRILGKPFTLDELRSELKMLFSKAD